MLMRRWIDAVVRLRFPVLIVTLAITAGLAAQIGKLRVEIDPNRFLPQSHPYVVTSNRVEALFGSRYVLVVGITPLAGDVYAPPVLAKVERITRALREDPGVLKNTVLSFAARKAKSIGGSADGMEIRPLMERVPQSPAALEALRARIAANPAYQGTVVSADGRSAAVIAEFRDDPKGFRAIMDRVHPVVEAERDDTVTIALGGIPVLLAQFELYSERMALFLPIAMLLIGAVLWLSFRSVQGLFLPLATGILAVLWSLGIMSAAGVPLDVFNATTPILILAVASGHAVQILKRYHEEYERAGGHPDADPAPAMRRVASRRAVVDSLARVGPVMLVAGLVAALGFLSLTVFEISSVRTFGIFAACGILSSLALELTLIPALRATMPPPPRRATHGASVVIERVMTRLADAVLGRGAARIGVAALVVIAVALAGSSRLRIEESFRQLFSAHLPVLQDDAHLNARFGGTNALYVLVDGKTPGRIQDPEVLAAIDGMQRLLDAEPYVGKTLSIADFVRRMNRAMHADDPAYDRIPAERGLVAQYLFLYANGGDPGDFDTLVDYDYRYANIQGFLKEHDTHKLTQVVQRLKRHAEANFPPDVGVSFGGSVAQGTAIHEIIVRSKILNMLQLAGVIFALAALVFRSLLAGLLVLVPLATTVVVNFGLMGWAGIPFNVPNSITSAMAVGIGADYVIYLLFRQREELAASGDFDAALRRTLRTAGTAVVFVAGAVAAGYSVLMLSDGFWTHIWMGMLISSAMLVSAIAALTLVPVLLRWLRPAFVTRPAATAPVAVRAASLALAACAVLLLAPAPAGAQALAAEEIMRRNHAIDKVAGSQSRVVLTLRNRQGQERLRESVSLTRLQPNGVDNRRVVRFHAPADVRGTAILLVEQSRADDDMWIYLPALKKVRRLVASNKKDSFAGSDFSYGDVIGHAVEHWRHTLVAEGAAAGEACHVIESVPVRDAVREESGYSKRRSCISKTRYTLLRLETWDTEGQLQKVAEFEEHREVAPGRWIAMRARARNLQTGHATELQFTDYRVDASIPLEAFSPRALELGS